MEVSWVIFILSSVGIVLTQEYCVTPNKEDGVCKPIFDCEVLRKMIKGSLADREEVKRHGCGFDKHIPLACCPIKSSINSGRTPTTLTTATTSITTTTTTPATTTVRALPSLEDRCITRFGTFGTCVELTNCPKLNSMLMKPTQKAIDLVQRSRCPEYKEFIVCCDEVIINRYSKYQNCSSYETPPEPESKCCGIESPSPNKIINGNATYLDQHPWSAVIEYNNDREYSCGGTLISNKYVLTAAHCLLGQRMQPLGAESVVLGDYIRSNEGKDCVLVDGGGEDCNDGAISIRIAKTMPHEKYSPEDVRRANDIGLIKLQDAAPYTDFIRPICLPTKDITLNPPNKLRFTVVGWGAMDLQGHRSDIKLYANLPHVDQKRCRELYGEQYKTKLESKVWDTRICAGGEDGKDVCSGDSGGPLVYEYENFQEIVGVISFGLAKCGSYLYPSIYTKVYVYLDWIRSNMM